MGDRRSPIVPFDADNLVERLVTAAQGLGLDGLDDPELAHLVGVVTRCSALLGDVYTDERLRAILVDDPRRLARIVAAPWFRLPVADDLPQALHRMRQLPDEVRGVGDQALFDLSITGLSQVRGVQLGDLGPRAYRLAAEVLELLADDARLREHFVTAGALALPRSLEDEILFLRRCSERFDVYSRLLRVAGEDDPGGAASRLVLPLPRPEAGTRLPVRVEPSTPPAAPLPISLPVPLRLPGHGPGPAPRRLFTEGEYDREHLLAAYERLLLFASLDLDGLREELAARVVDQADAITTLIDDFALFAAGTQNLAKPASYFLVGPTGVGKNYLVETLARTLSRQWRLDVPYLTIEGPNYTYPSDINELRGATRGFIRSDEPGQLTEFHKRSSEAPLSIILVDEVEKAHPQLIRFFLSILDRGTTTDAHGNELNFSGSLIFFTSNIGYLERREDSKPIGFSGQEEAEAAYRAELSRSLRRALPPEFVNRVKIVRFRHLPRSSAEAILKLEFERIAQRYRELHDIELVLAPLGLEALLGRGYSHEYGARHLASVLERTCNVEIGKMLRRDEDRTGRDPAELLALLRQAKISEGAIDLAALDRQIAEQARARVAYRRIVVDAEEDEIVYRREER